MNDLPPNPNSQSDTDDEIGVGPDPGTPPSMPRWVKVLGLVVILLILLAIFIAVTGLGGEHGPGRHSPRSSVTEVHIFSSGRPGEHIPPIEQGLQKL